MKCQNPLLLFSTLFILLTGSIQASYGQCTGAAGPSQTLSCIILPGGTVTMAAADTGVWRAQSNNPGTAVIADSTNPATTIDTFSVAGTYHFIWIDTSGCADTVTVIVTTIPNAGPDQTDSCVALPGGTVTMAATGTGTWTVSGPGSAVITNAASPTTTVRTFNAPGTYHLIWSNGGCVDTAEVLVIAKPNAGPDQTANCVAFPGGSVTMAATGVGSWSEPIGGNPAGTDAITNITSPTTTITNFSAAGTYYFIWTNASGCSDTAAVVVNGLADAGPDLIDNCVVFPGGTVTMAANGTGQWTAGIGNLGTYAITTPSNPSTTITTFSAPGIYNFAWTSPGGCSDTIAVTVVGKPNAGRDTFISCSNSDTISVTMSATGTGIWTRQVDNPGTVTIADTFNPRTTITNFSMPGTYSFIWTDTSTRCTDTANVTISAQCECFNAGFSNGDFTGWTGTYGTNATQSGCVYPYPYQFTGFLQGPLNYPDNSTPHYSQVINNLASGNDPYLTTLSINIPRVSPIPAGQFNYSARIGSLWPKVGTNTDNPDAASIAYTFLVTPANSAFTYYYFPIINDGGHAEEDQPYFKIYMVTAAGDTVTCAGLDVDASNASTIGFNTVNDGFLQNGYGNIYYKRWTPVYIPLFNYVGQNVTIHFVTRSCNPGGCAGTHFAVAYVDAQCGPINLTVNSHNTCTQNGYTLIAPAGLASYNWSGPGISNATGDSIHVTQSGRYTVTMTTIGTAPCTFTMDTNITISPILANNANFTFDSTCLGNTTYFHDISTSTGTITSWAWDFNNTGTTNSTTQISSYTYPSAGTYHVKLTITVGGCTSDTIIPVIIGTPPTSTFTASGPVCIGQLSTIRYTGNGLPTDSFNWNFNGGTIISGSGRGPYRVKWGTPGTKNITLTVSEGTCTSPRTTVPVTVLPNPNAGPDDTVSCIILPGGTARMLALDSGIWRAQPNNPDTFAIITHPDSAHTTITNFRVAGTYHFIWTNSQGCTDTAAVLVTSKPNAGPDKSVICAVLPGGSTTMSATGLGTWSADSPNNPGQANIVARNNPNTIINGFTAPGVYSFIWTNFSGCTDTATVTVTQEPTINLPNAAYCLGNSTTLAPSVAPSGGSFLWNTGDVTPTLFVDTIVPAVFHVTYTLGNCSASTSASVTIYPLPLATVTTIPSVCTADNGQAVVHPSAGTPGYTYSWSPPGGTNVTLDNLSPNNYQVTVTDVHQCTVTASCTIGLQTPDLFVTEVSQHNLKCFNDATGDIYINTLDTARNSGAYIYSYAWSNTRRTPNLINVQAGPYSVTVTDQFGCTGTLTDTLTQPPPLAASTTFTNPQCFGYSNGTATLINPSGGSGAYYYAWSTNPIQNAQGATGLPSGLYTVSMTDDSACLLTLPVSITDPLQIAFANPTIVQPSCFGFSNGSILVFPQNGIGNYSYVWSTVPPQNTPLATGLISGFYTVTVTDSNSCIGIENIFVNQPSLLTVTISPVDILCYGYNDGVATADPYGGTPPYTYKWNDQETTQTISNLVIGTYGVTTTDNNACTASATTTLTQPTKVTEILTALRDSCPFTATGKIFDTASGGVGSFTYSLDNNGVNIQTNTTGVFTGLVNDLYTVVATDQNGCPVSDTITVPNAPFNYYTDTAISTTCFGPQYQDGIIHVQGFAIPNGPFRYSLDGGPLRFITDFYNLAAGPHTIFVEDNYGCDTTFTVVVPEPLPPSLQILPGDSTIDPGASIQLSNVFGPYSPDSIKTYLWSPSDGLNCIDCPSPVASPYSRQTVYSLVITYNQGCVDTAFVTINVKGEPPLYIPNAFTPNGNETNDRWYVFSSGIKDIKIMIFNRWGEKIYESYNQFEGWDGRYKGQLQTPGVYIYEVQIVYLDGVQITRNGSVTLIR